MEVAGFDSIMTVRVRRLGYVIYPVLNLRKSVLAKATTQQ